jgi:hypothetical protein
MAYFKILYHLSIGVATPTVLPVPAAGQHIGHTTEAPSELAYQRDHQKQLLLPQELYCTATVAVTSCILCK